MLLSVRSYSHPCSACCTHISKVPKTLHTAMPCLDQRVARAPPSGVQRISTILPALAPLSLKKNIKLQSIFDLTRVFFIVKINMLLKTSLSYSNKMKLK